MPDAEDGSESVGRNAAAGAGGGAAAGAMVGLEASLDCGVYVLFCAPVFAAMGAAVGTVAGTVYGVSKGAARALPKEKATAVESIIETTLAETNIAGLLEDEFRRNNAGRWRLAAGSSPTTLTIGIDALYLEQATGDELAVELHSFARIRYGAGESDQTKKILFRWSSEKHHVDHWIAEDGRALRSEIARSFAEVTRQMNAALVK